MTAVKNDHLFLHIISIVRWIGVALNTILLIPASFVASFFDREGRVSNLVHRLWARITLFCVGARVSIYGLKYIDPNKHYVIASNHEGSVEIPIYMGYLPLSFRFAAKRSLFRIPFFGWAMNHARHVPIDRGQGQENARVSLARLSQKLQKGFSILMFPEGTRTRDGKLGKFRSGTFRLALDNGVSILPVATYGSFRGKTANEWTIRPGRIVVKIGAPLKVKTQEVPGYSEADVETIKNDCHEVIGRLHEEAGSIDRILEEMSRDKESLSGQKLRLLTEDQDTSPDDSLKQLAG